MEKARNVDIRQFYREDLGVHSEELLDKLEAVSQAVTLQKGEILNKKGERQTMLPFLIEGMMRCVTLDREGKEKTVGFTMSRGDVVLSNMDLTGCHISTDQAMVPSTLILLPIDYVLQNMKDEPEVIRVYQEQIVKWGMIYQSRAVSLSQGDATERFEWFCKEYPGMIDMVNNRYIASFLGITPVTLTALPQKWAAKSGQTKNEEIRQHRTIPALRLKHRSGGCGTSLAVSALRIMRYCHNNPDMQQRPHRTVRIRYGR